jgi:hypothetical protein
MSNCPNILKPRQSGLNVCTSDVCFDANFTCINIPLGASLSQALVIMEQALCDAIDAANAPVTDVPYTGTIPTCITVVPTPTVSEMIEAVATEVCNPTLPVVSYEYSDIQPADHSWQDATATLVPGMIHTVLGPDGDYTIHVHLIDTYADNSNGTITLDVQGVTVATWGPMIQNGITSVYMTDSFVWRGPILSGQTVKVFVEKVGVPNISTKNFSWLINKS